MFRSFDRLLDIFSSSSLSLFLRTGAGVFFILLMTWSCQDDDSRFRLVGPRTSGIDFVNAVENTPELNILNYLYFYNGGGVAAADFNNDGLDDIYFTSNLEEDQLYLNKGGLKFENITAKSGIENNTPWTTGVSTVDINNDGWLDIYVCKIGKYRNISGHNLLYVNQGTNDENIPVFEEQSARYRLNISAFSTQSTFLDYDRDGDLDLFLLNHSVHPNRSYGRGTKREQINAMAGDKLLENRDGKFFDVSLRSGIFQGEIGYGLGVSVSDINSDGFPDIYVGNDFFENDYLYINNKDGTFKELITSDITALGHTTHFSMGNDIADLNNDLLPDMMSVDMLPENLETYKTSALEYNYQIYSNYLRNGYAPQFMQNTLHLNRGNLVFSETAHLSGVAATEWSWSPLIADFDNDGFNDIYITNGILGATNDMDFINFIADETIQQKIETGLTEEDQAFIDRLPKKKTRNYFFRNTGENRFEDMSDDWIDSSPTYSNGAAYSDLDNDGDLDLIINNVNEPAQILENRTTTLNQDHHFIKINLNGPEENIKAIGSKITVYSEEKTQFRELYVSRGYLSAVSYGLNFGLGNETKIDSVIVEWPDGKTSRIKNVNADSSITIDYNSTISETNHKMASLNIVPEVSDSLPVVEHRDNSPIEFNRDPLIPFASSNLGPDLSVADINNDGMDDFFICGSKGQTSALYVQHADGTFEIIEEPFETARIAEDISAEFGDFDKDGDLDLVVVSGGNEFKTGETLKPRYYSNELGVFTEEQQAFRGINVNASTVKSVDLDSDGDLDLCITSDCTDLEFGKTPIQYLLINDGQGHFTDQTEELAPRFRNIGNVMDVHFSDLNEDGRLDMIVAGYWMPVSVFYQGEKGFTLISGNGLDLTKGWWNTVAAEDFDKDGDIDLICGNWGLNSRLTASYDYPLTLYSFDFDSNGSKEPLVTYFSQGVETPFSSKEDLAKQMPFINKDYLSYKDFAGASLEDVFGKENLEQAEKKQVWELASCYFENDGNGNFTKKLLPFDAQLSTVRNIVVFDFNDDGYYDIHLTGNNYEINTQLSRLDASHGELLLNDQQGGFKPSGSHKFFLHGVVQDSEFIRIGEALYLMFGRNNESVKFIKIN